MGIAGRNGDGVDMERACNTPCGRAPARLDELDIDCELINYQLMEDGVRLFARAYNDMLQSIEQKRQAAAGQQ